MGQLAVRVRCALALCLAFGIARQVYAAPAGLDMPPSLSAATQTMAQHVVTSGDHFGLPFAIVDKTAATLSVFAADGHLVATSAVLLGLTPGDGALPGVGHRTQAGTLSLADRTTPAGRFVSVPGRNLSGEAIVWLDYDKAFAIHRLRPGPANEHRAERLASPSAGDNRISAGCVVTPVAFFENVVEPLLGHGRAVVYVLPEMPEAARVVAGV